MVVSSCPCGKLIYTKYSPLTAPSLRYQARASLYIYSTPEEVDTFCAALASTIEMFKMLEE